MNRYFFLIIVLFSVLLPVAWSADLVVDSVNLDPTPAIPGDDLRIWVHVKNNIGTPASNAFLTLNLSDPARERNTPFPFSLSPDDTSTRSLGNLRPFETAVVSFTLQVAKDALDGDYRLAFVLGENEREDKRSLYTVKVLNRDPQVEIVSVNPVEVTPGQHVPLNLSVKNIGPSTAYTLRAGVEEDRTVTSTGVIVERLITPVGPSLAYLDSLASGQEEVLSIDLSVDSAAEIKTYTVPVTLKWVDANRVETSITRYIGLRVNEIPPIDAVISEVSPLLTAGVTSEVTVDLLNTGASTARNIVVYISTPLSEQVSPEKIFIGSLEADDFDSFNTDVSVPASAAPGKSTLDVRVEYRNANYEPASFEKSLPVTIVTFEEAYPGTGAAALTNLVFLLIVLGIGFWYYRRRRRARTK